MKIKNEKICVSKKFIILIILTITLFSGILITNNYALKTKKIIKNRAEEMNSSSYLSKEIFRKNVLVLVNDPLIPINGQSIRFSDWIKGQDRRWNSPDDLTKGIIDTFYEISNGRINYFKYLNEIKTINYDFLKKKSTTLTLDDYIRCLEEKDDKESDFFINFCQSGIDLERFIKDNDICKLVDSGYVDEVWVWGYSWIGMQESQMIGKNSYQMNGSPVLNLCSKPFPIMGFNLSTGLDNALHDFGHRMEGTMARVYGEENLAHGVKEVIWPINNRWDKFAAVKLKTPDRNLSGIGMVHFPPNAIKEYQYDSEESIVTYISDFNNYSSFTDSALVSKSSINITPTSINCHAWECTHLGYMKWWFAQFPQFTGEGYDKIKNDWMAYFINPTLANTSPYIKKTFSELREECNGFMQKWFECGKCGTIFDQFYNICPELCKVSCPIWKTKEKCNFGKNTGFGCEWDGSICTCILK